MGRRRHTWGPNVVPLCDVLREKPGHSLPAFSGVPGENASEDFGSSFHLIKTEDFLRNAGLVGRDQQSPWTPIFLSVLSLATQLIHAIQVLFCVELVKKVCCDLDVLPLHLTMIRHDYDQL